jgi:gag-polypeptide of LTR copia-type
MTEGMFTFPTPNQTTQISTFLRPNIDFNTSQKLTDALLNGKNYIPWAKAVRVTLKGKALLGYVNESKVRPIEGVKLHDEWNMVVLVCNNLEVNNTIILLY